MYEGLGLKQYESEAEYGDLEVVSPGKVLQGERGVAERRENMRDRHIKTQLKLATSYLFWGNWIKVTNCVFKWQV